MNYEMLHQTIARTRIVDTHEHFLPRTHLAEDLDLFSLLGRSYLMSDFISAGMPPEAWGSGSEAWRRAQYAPGEEIWSAAKAFMPAIRDTGFFRIWRIVLRDLYDVPEGEFTDQNWRAISEKIAQRYSDPGWMDSVIGGRAGIDTVIWDNYWQIESPDVPLANAVPALRANTFIYGPGYRQRYTNNTPVERIADSFGLSLGTLQDYFDLWEEALQRYAEHGVAAIKIAVAYERDMAFEEVPERELSDLFGKLGDQTSPGARRRFQDGMVHHVLRSAGERGLPVQVHTGLQGGNANRVGNTNPLPLCPVFERYPHVKFSLLHVAYPFADEAIALAKMFPNVYLDLAWHCGLSPHLAVETLKKTLGTVPTNKITWGADSHIVEEAYGAAALFRSALTKALTWLIDECEVGEQRAADVARMIMRQNALALFRL